MFPVPPRVDSAASRFLWPPGEAIGKTRVRAERDTRRSCRYSKIATRPSSLDGAPAERAGPWGASWSCSEAVGRQDGSADGRPAVTSQEHNQLRDRFG
jgi:hypothetical protein